MGTSRFVIGAAIVTALLVSSTGSLAHRAVVVRTGNVIAVPATADLQSALNRAAPGDTIVLQAGAQYVGSFRLPRKAGDAWVTIQSSAVDGRRFPPAGTRVTPDDAAGMARILGPAASALRADPGAHHYRFVGLEFAPTPGTFLFNLVDLGGDATVRQDVPHHFAFERCYFHGDAMTGGRRGIALNSADTTVTDSYFSQFKEVGADSQAIAGWNGPGPFQLLNNYFSAAGENVMFGGADPAIPDLVPSDIDVRRNTFVKPLEWRVGDPAYQGTPWTVKNLFELKNARRVRVDANTFDNNWVHAQNGFAILFTVRNQDGRAPWSVVEDVFFTNNIVRHVGGGVNILGHDDIHDSQQAQRIVIRNNVFDDVSERWGGGRLFQLLNGTRDVTIDHNTAFQTEVFVFGGDTLAHEGFVLQNNIAPHNQYGIIGSGTGVGNVTLEHYFPGAVIKRNVIAGGNPSLYPGDNFFPGNVNDVGFVDRGSGNVRLKDTSSFRGKGTDGHDLGADLNAIAAARAGRTRPIGGRQ